MGRRRANGRDDLPSHLYQDRGTWYFRKPDTKEKIWLGKDERLAKNAAREFNRQYEELAIVEIKKKIENPEQVLLAPEFSAPAAEDVPTFAVYVFEDDGAFDMWMEDEEPAEGTIRNIRYMLEQIIREAPWSSLPLNQITTQMISEYLKAAASSRREAMRSKLGMVFDYAISEGYVEQGKNPVDITRKGKKHRVNRMRLEWDHFRLMRDYARSKPELLPLANALDLTLVTGQRIGNIVGFEFSFAGKDGWFRFRQNKVRNTMQPKLLAFPLALKLDKLDMSLDDCIKQCRNTLVASRYLIHKNTARGRGKVGDPLHRNTLSGLFREVYEAVGIKADVGKTRATFHELRSLSARLYKDQESEAFASRVLAHKDKRTTERYFDERKPQYEYLEMPAA